MATEARRDDGFRTLVRHSRLQMQEARNFYYEAKLDQRVERGVRRTLASALIAYYDTLWEYKTKRQDVEQAWDESNVDQIQELKDQVREVQQPAPGDTDNGTTATVPALLAIDPEYLVALSKELDSLAADLGFTAGVEKDRKLGKAGDEELWEDHPDAQESES